MAASEDDVRRRLIEARLAQATQRMGVTYVSPQERERGEMLSTLAQETNPYLAGFGAALSDIGAGMKQLGVLGAMGLNNWQVTSSGTTMGDLIPGLADIGRDDYEAIARTAANERELFEELAKRRPEAMNTHFWTTLGALMLMPESRLAEAPQGLTWAQRLWDAAKASRGATLRSEAAAGAASGATMPSQDPNQQLAQLVGGAFAGGVINRFGAMMSATGRMIVGGQPATIQRVEDLLQTERDLNAVGLLTTSELRGGTAARRLGRIEGILDNMPLPIVSLSEKRTQQANLFQNAVATIRAAFPNVTADDALRMVRTQLERNETEARAAFARVAESVPEAADSVGVSNYVHTAQRLLDEELAKGARADPGTVAFLRSQSEVESVPFAAAQGISSDLGRRTRIAERSAQDPAATGIDAGRLKQLSLAHYKDLEQWARAQSPETLALWNEAKEFWRLNVLPFNKRPLAPIFDAGYDSASFARFLSNPTNARDMAPLNSDNALGFLLVNDAIEQATQSNGLVDVRKLTTLLANRNRNIAIERLVPEESRELLVGLDKLVQAAPRALMRPQGNVLATTAGSAAVAGTFIGGGMLGMDDPQMGAAVGFASLGLIRYLVGTQQGRAILTAAAHTRPDNRRAFAELAGRARTLVQRGVLLEAESRTSDVENIIIEQLRPQQGATQ